MTSRAHQECRHPRCPQYATADGFCADHQRLYRERVASPPGLNLRPSNPRFRRLRGAYLMRHPMCAECRTKPARELDHIVPHRGVARLFWDQANWQGLCKLCHGRKSARELVAVAVSPSPEGKWGAKNLGGWPKIPGEADFCMSESISGGTPHA